MRRGSKSASTGQASSSLLGPTYRRPSLASPGSRTGTAELPSVDQASGSLDTLPENLGAALHRSVSGSTGGGPPLGRPVSPRSSVASATVPQGRRTLLGSFESHGPRSSGSRLSVIQVQSSPPDRRSSLFSGSRVSQRSSVGVDSFDTSAAPTPRQSSQAQVEGTRASFGEVSLPTTSETSKSCKSVYSEAAQPKLSKEIRVVETPPVAQQPPLPPPQPPQPPAPSQGRSSNFNRGSCSTSESGDLRGTDSDCTPRYISGTNSSLTRLSPRLPIIQSVRRKAAPYCRLICKNKVFQVIMFGALLSALFLPDLWILLDRPGNNDLDGILCCVLFMFLVELVVQSIGLARTYWGSFFFWMDLLGAASLLLDLSFLSIGGTNAGVGESGSNVVILRAARMAKLGARAGRLTQLAKLLRFLPFMKHYKQGSEQGTAKVMSAKLITSLSMRVSLLIILMVMIMPLFSIWTYPKQDWSMQSWIDILESASNQYPDSFQEQLLRFGAFYDDMGYYPYRLSAKPGAALPTVVTAVLPWDYNVERPRRAANSVRYESSSLVYDFNISTANQNSALMNIFLLLLIIFLLVGWSLMLSNFVSAQVLRPLEKLLLQVRLMASRIFQSVSDMTVTMASEANGAGAKDGEDDHSDAMGNETELLERVVAKLAVLGEIAMSKNVDPETMEELGAADRAVIRGYQGHGSIIRHSAFHEVDEDLDLEAVRAAQKAMLESAGLSLDVIDSDNLNPLELDRARLQAAAMYFLGQLHHGMAFDPVAMQHFLEAAELGYNKSNLYHNWYHAVDIAHFIYRLLRQCSAEQYLSGCERFALLVSAISHDIGHPGVNNIFLVDTVHDLALRYNDKSPLENMHCARLFELVSTAKCDIFSLLSKHQFQDVRKVCIEVILHTDNAQHFIMIKEVQMFYEVHSQVFDAIHDTYEYVSVFSLTQEAVDQLSLPDSRKLMAKLFLHFADISNCMKPFRVCRLWAMKIMEEFFLQGDQEKKMGVTVQALNDREKVNRAFSQVGFIEFLVSPMMAVVIKVMVPLELYAEQMIINVKRWHQIWLAETTPEPTDAEQKNVAERIAKLSNKFLGGQS